MLTRLKNYFFEADISITSEDEQKEFVALLRNILHISAGAVVLIMILVWFSSSTLAVSILGGVLTIMFISYIALLRGFTTPASIITPLSMLIAVILLALNSGGLYDISVLGLGAIVIVGSLTLGKKGTLVFGILTALAILLIGLMDLTGIYPTYLGKYVGAFDLVIGSVIMLSLAAIQTILINRLNHKTIVANTSANEQAKTNAELKQLQHSLEDRIAERTAELQNRTAELEQNNTIMARTARQFEGISQVARAISNIHDMDELLKRITLFTSSEFSFYHTGIYLLDEDRTYAVLVASNSTGGQKMVARKHRQRVGEQGMVGIVAATGRFRLAQDISQDEVFYNVADLAETRSELTLPLIEQERVIGVLDIQSTVPNDFSTQDINALTALANLVSIAIENTRLHELNRRALEEADAVTRQYVRAQWSDIANKQGYAGFKYDVKGSSELEKPLEKKPIRQAVQRGQVYMGDDEQKIPSLAVPVKLRDQVIGVINISTPGKKRWSADEVDMVKAIAERVAISAENARLFDASQERAVTEQTIGQISAKLGSSINIQSVLQTAVEELGRVLSGSEVAIQLLGKEKAAQPPTGQVPG